MTEKKTIADFGKEIEEFRRDGVIVLRNLISAPDIASLQSAAQFAVKHPTPLAQDFARTSDGCFHSDMYLSASFPQFRDFLKDSCIGAVGAKLLKSSKVFLFNDEILIKSPNTAHETPWHHDFTYWPLQGRQVCSVWFPLDPTTKRNGGMEFLRGSHDAGVKYHPRNFATGADRITSEDERSVQDVQIDARDVVSFDVEPGDAIVFHSLTLHRAFGNQHPSLPRRAVVYRLVGDDVTFAPRPRTIPVIWAPDLKAGEPFRDSELFPQLR